MKLYAEWIEHRGAYRLYQPEEPQQTVAYADNLEELKEEYEITEIEE